MKSFLLEISEEANASVSAAINAQLQVIQYVQSPHLYDSTFDLFFYNIEQAINKAESVSMKKSIQDKAALMINNYVFFINAKLQYEISSNKEQEKKLVKDAADLLSESVIQVANLYMGNDVSKVGSIIKISLKVFESDNKGESFVSKIIDWYYSKEKIKKKKVDFYNTMYNLSVKLYKHRGIIGKSSLISSLSTRYIDEIIDTKYPLDLLDNSLVEEKEKYKSRLLWWEVCLMLISFVVFIIRFLFYFVTDSARSLFEFFSVIDPSITVERTWAKDQFIITISVLGLVFIIISVLYLIKSIKIKRVRKKCIVNRTKLGDELLLISESFES